MPKGALAQAQGKVVRVGASSCSRWSTTEVGINALASGIVVGFSLGLLTGPHRKSNSLY